jgi:TP901 family phage tail tape measure protein
MSLLGNIWVKLGLKSDDFNRGMDNAEKRTKTFGESMKAVAGKVMAAVAAVKMLAGTAKIITNFEASVSKLASVLGTTPDKLDRMTDSAIELGRKTQYTASEVVGLQTELAKLGFAEPQILAMQESVLKFAAAVGTDLPSAAARAGATMRGFGLTAEETTDMLNVMAVSTSKSALSFNYLDSTLGKLVPVAKSFGLDTEGTIALLGTLANAGIDASSAGTALRAIFIKLADSSSDLNKAMGGQPKTMEELIKGFQKLRDKGIDLSDASDMVNDRFAAMLLTLANGADDVADLYGELQNANGALDEMYDTMTHNVKGAIAEVKSAWEGFVLSLRNSSGVLFSVLQGVKDLINDLNYAMFYSAKESEQTSQYYDVLSRTIAETTDKAGALEIAYKRLMQTAQAKVTDLEGKSALGRLLNHESLDEAKASVAALQSAYNRLKEELSGGAVSGGITVTTDEEENPLDGILSALSKEKTQDAEDGLRELTAAAREYAKEISEINAYDDEMARQAAEMYEAYHKEAGGIDEVTQALVEMNNKTIASLDDAERVKDKLTDISDDIMSALRQGAIAGLNELADAIGSGEWDTSKMVRALLNPLADAAISLGTIVMTSGEAMQALNEALESMGENPYAAIAIGAALVGVGVAAKAGIAAIAKNSSGSSNTNGYTYTGGYGVTPAMMTQNAGSMEISGTVTVKGQDLQIALDNYNRNKTR